MCTLTIYSFIQGHLPNFIILINNSNNLPNKNNILIRMLARHLSFRFKGRPLQKADSSTATLEFPKISRNPTIHYRAHKNPSLVPMLSQINQIHINKGSPSDLLISWLPTKIHFLPNACYMRCPSHPLWLHINCTWRQVLTIMQLALTSPRTIHIT